jgi:starch-binding outer membrane protein, SusD/RagB family
LLPTMLMTAGITTNTLGWQVPTEALALDYAPDDERGPVTVFNKFQESVAGEDYDVSFDKYYFRKYWDTEAPKEFSNEQAAQDFSVIRYADVLLMYAEVLNESAPSDEAHNYLNMIRTRAGLGEVSGLSQDQFRSEVLEQRKLELAAEGHRWFDLVRTGELEALVPVSKLGVIPQPRYNLFPIPQSERDLNTNLPQNDY